MALVPLDTWKKIATSTALAYTGISVTVPARHYFALSAWGHFNGSAPKEIAISASSTDASQYNLWAHTSTARRCGACDKTGDTPLTLYLWARYGSAARNDVGLVGFAIPA